MDVMQQVLDLLEDNWTSANTDGQTPVFLKITDPNTKSYNSMRGTDLIMAQVPVDSQESAGIGRGAKRIHSVLNVDVRIFGIDQEAHFIKVVDEILRVVDTKINNPPSGWQVITADFQTQQNLSDKNKGLFRKIIPLKLDNNNIAR